MALSPWCESIMDVIMVGFAQLYLCSFESRSPRNTKSGIKLPQYLLLAQLRRNTPGPSFRSNAGYPISQSHILSQMAKFNFNLLHDELSLPAWLALGAVAQAGISVAAPAQYALVPAVFVLTVLVANFALQYLGLYRNYYLKNARMGRISVLFPEKDGSRPEDMGDKPVTMFLLGLRSNTTLGRLSPAYQKLNNYLDEMYQDCDENRVTNGCKSRVTRVDSSGARKRKA